MNAVLLLALLFPGQNSGPSGSVSLEEIVTRGTAAINTDWAADPDYAYIERDETGENGKVTSKTSQVVMIAGSDYYMPLAIDDEPLSPEEQKVELAKLKSEVARRNAEDPASRRKRIAAYRKERDENGSLLLDFPHAFSFELLREDTWNGHPAYVLAANPKKRSGPLTRAARVLSGMQGTLWVDRQQFHTMRAECSVVSPVPVYGILARVMPGTEIELEMTPVSDSIWLVGKVSMKLALSKLFLFHSAKTTVSTYTAYRLNSAVLEDLLSK